MTKLRFTDDSLNYNIEGINTAEIRSDRQPTDLIQTGRESTGGFNFEFSYGAFDDLLEGALFGDWTGVHASGMTITSGATGSNLEFTLNATNNTIALGSAATHQILSGQWIRLANAATANNGHHFVTNVSGQTLTVQSITTGEVLDETDAATITGSRLRNGTVEHGYSVERNLADKGDFFRFLGCMVNSMTITASASAIVTGSFDFIGQEASSGVTSISTKSYAEGAANDIMNAVANVGTIMEGVGGTMTTLTGQFIQELSFTVNNNMRGIQAIGYAYNVDVGAGQLELSGTLNLYYEDLTIYNKFVNSTTSGISFRLEDNTVEGNGNAYVFTFPRVRFASDVINVGGQNTDVMENMTWAGLRHPTFDYTMQVCKFNAP
jgi:hypothetical protein